MNPNLHNLVMLFVIVASFLPIIPSTGAKTRPIKVGRYSVQISGAVLELYKSNAASGIQRFDLYQLLNDSIMVYKKAAYIVVI